MNPGYLSLFVLILIRCFSLTGNCQYVPGPEKDPLSRNRYRISGNEPDTIRIEEVTVSGRHSPDIYSGLSRIVYTIGHETIREMPVNDLQGILEYVTSLDIRQRGSHGVQADISMRGGSFEQVLILLNGVRVNDPQTGHHNLNIPVHKADIERIEILEGPGSRVYGPNAFTGAINIITKDPGSGYAAAAIKAGEYGYSDLYASGGFSSGPVNHYISLANKSSGGFAENTDFNISNIFLRSSFDGSFGSFDLQAGYLDKEFGASNFYSSLYPDQFEKIRATFTNITFRTGSRVNYRQSAYRRRHTDRFELFRYDAAPWYEGHNYHLTDIFGSTANISIPWAFGSLYLGGELRNERIYSSVLGEKTDTPKAVRNEANAVYDHFKQRSEVNLTAGGSFIYNGIAVSSGLLLSNNSHSGWGVYGGIDMSYSFNREFGWFASWNQSLRIPTFTEMYYRGPVHRGNSRLSPEQAGTIETGLRYLRGNLQAHITLFNRKGYDIIDWVKREDELVWESRNILELHTYGAEFEFTWKRGDEQGFPVRKVRTGYSYIDISKQSEQYISAYVLDHLKHKFVAGITVPVYRSAEIVLMALFQDRAGTYTSFESGTEIPYDPFILADSGISFLITGSMTGTVSVNNLFNNGYTDIGNVPVPGRWIKAGINVGFPFKR